MICVSGAGQIKRAKAFDNVLNHTSENDKKAKADMVAKIIDNEGARFGNDVLRKSKVMKETRQLNPEKTLGLMTYDLPIVFASSATVDGLPLKMRTSFHPRLWATTDEYHFTHEYL